MNLYLVLAMRTAHFDPDVLPAHYAHLDALRARGALEAFGPFTDQSGGGYILRAESLDAARAMAFSDPVHITGSSEVSVREWNLQHVAELGTT